MAGHQSETSTSSGEERLPILEDLLLLAFCSLVGMAGLAVVAWEVISGRVFSIDGLWLSLISLTLATVFGGNLAWSFYTGEAAQLLRHFHRGSMPHDASGGEKRAGP